MFSGYESLNLWPLHLKTRCTIIYWFGMSISKCCNVIKHFPYSRAVLLIATIYKLKILEAQQTSGAGWTVINVIDDDTVILLIQVGLEDIKSIVDMLDLS